MIGRHKIAKIAPMEAILMVPVPLFRASKRHHIVQKGKLLQSGLVREVLEAGENSNSKVPGKVMVI